MDQQSRKDAPKFAALPPPGHHQWNNVPGNENGTPVRGAAVICLATESRLHQASAICPLPPDTVAHIPPCGANFKVDKRGAKLCINWKRGLCKFAERCIFRHDGPAPVPAAVAPLVEFRAASDQGKEGGGEVASDWYQEGADPAPGPPIQPKRLNTAETDFTKVAKKKSKWD